MTSEIGPKIAAAIERLLEAPGASRSISPEDAAREAAADGADWHRLLVAVRREAISGAIDGRLVILRKGKPVDPNDFKGVYRIAKAGSQRRPVQGEGNSALDLPDA